MSINLKKSLILSLVLLFSYQNCSQNNLVSHSEKLLESNFQNSETQKIEQKIQDLQVQGLKFNLQIDREIQKNGNTFYLKEDQFFLLDLKSGIFSAAAGPSGETANHNQNQKYCLSDQMKIDLQNLLETSSVCEEKKLVSSDTVCAQVLQQPYAELILDQSSVLLGYATDSCKTETIDLCEDQSVRNLKNWIQSIQNQLAQMQCQL